MCHNPCTVLLFFSLSADAGWRYCRANRSLDVWKRRMTTSLRYVALRPGSFYPNICFFLLMHCSSDKEHCSSRDTVCQWIRSRSRHPNWRQHRLVCIFCFSLGPMSHSTWTTLSGRIAKLSSSASTSMTTLQREILRFVLIIASLATSLAILIVILWAAW